MIRVGWGVRESCSDGPTAGRVRPRLALGFGGAVLFVRQQVLVWAELNYAGQTGTGTQPPYAAIPAIPEKLGPRWLGRNRVLGGRWAVYGGSPVPGLAGSCAGAGAP